MLLACERSASFRRGVPPSSQQEAAATHKHKHICGLRRGLSRKTRFLGLYICTVSDKARNHNKNALSNTLCPVQRIALPRTPWTLGLGHILYNLNLKDFFHFILWKRRGTVNFKFIHTFLPVLQIILQNFTTGSTFVCVHCVCTIVHMFRMFVCICLCAHVSHLPARLRRSYFFTCKSFSHSESVPKQSRLALELVLVRCGEHAHDNEYKVQFN